jgi:tetratricopeptide (TPR) repeat protein
MAPHRSITTSLLLSLCILLRAQQPATVREYAMSFPTYAFSDPSPIPLLSNVYPYFRFDGFTDHPSARNWKVVELENAYIRLLILPEIGGKIWAAIERSTNRPFLYYNHAVKFRDVAMRGPWTSGGLEANYGIIGHTPNCATPVDYTTKTNPDGSVSCIIGTLDLLSRSYWRMEIRLPKDEARFITRSFWYNTTAQEQPYYHWMNAGLKTAGDLEFIYPGNRYLGHEGEFSDWPINKTNGKNISWYKNNDFGGYKSYHVFGKYTEFSGAYWHDDDMGMVRYGRHDDKAGKKLWIWGLSGQGMIWEKLLTDTDGQYIELQSGRLFNQNAAGSSLTPFKHRAFQPYGTETWEESWYPVLHTKGFVVANDYGALNVLREDGRVKLLFSPVRGFNDTLRVVVDGKTIYARPCSFTPLRLFTDSLPAATGHLVVTIGELQYDSDPNAGVLARPVQTPPDFNWNTAYGAYLKGAEAMDQKNYPEAEAALQTALLKDSNFTPALTQYANLLYRNMRYTEALRYAARALSINTEDGPANFVYGLANEALGHITDAKDGFDIASLDPAYRSAAYTRLAILEKNTARARLYTEKALLANPLNIEALHLQAVYARPDNTVFLDHLDNLDPLDHFIRCERWLANPTATTKQDFLSLIRSELPQQTFLELGIWYYNIGRTADALRVFQLSPPDVEISLWIAFLNHQQPNYAALDPTRVFPFRSETATMLESLPGDHWLPKYFLALIYHDRNRLTECKQLLAACGDTPNFAPFYAFRAALSDTPLNDLRRARSLDPSWRYQKLLAEYYMRTGQYSDALANTSSWYEQHPQDYIMGLLHAKILLLNRQYAAADKLLTHLDVLPAEGATSGRELYREAKLMEAVESIKKKQYRNALGFVDDAKRWPENLGSGEPYPQDLDLRLEDFLTRYCQAAMQKGPPPPRPSLTSQADTRILNAL